MTALDKDVAVAVAGSGARGVARGVAAKAKAEERTLSPLSPLSPQAAVVAGCESVARTGVVVANLRVAARTAEEMAPHTEGVAGSGSGVEVAPSGARSGAGPGPYRQGACHGTRPELLACTGGQEGRMVTPTIGPSTAVRDTRSVRPQSPRSANKRRSHQK